MPGAASAWFLIGPTGIGKTALSIPLAEALGAEIVCMDSMQLYRGLQVATAQPEALFRARVRHHLFETVELTEVFDAARYAAAAAALVEPGRRLLFVGGTGLYYQALVAGLAPLPPRDPAVRAAIQASLEAGGAETLRQELAAADPVRAAAIGPNDLRRLERALEVLRVTGKPPSALRVQAGAPAFAPVVVLGLRGPRPWLHARLRDRLDGMVRAGLVEEMHGLWKRFGEGSEPTALQAIGYRPFVEHFAGRASEAEALAKVLIQTNRLVRHQETWFRKRPEVRWVEADREDASARLVGLARG